MKLFYSVNSPFARKARVVILEKGLEDSVGLVSVNPLENPPELLAANPLGKIPALVTDDGKALVESPVICEYLDAFAPAVPLYPTGDERWEALNLAALADGVMDAVVATVMESRRPQEKQWDEWVKRYKTAAERAIAVMEPLALAQEDAINIGSIAAAVALAYVSFRRPDIAWRQAHPTLAAWYDAFAKRPSMRQTEPDDSQSVAFPKAAGGSR